MATENAQTQEGSLLDFSFDDQNTFFGLKEDGSPVEVKQKDVLTEVKGEDDDTPEIEEVETTDETDTKDTKKKVEPKAEDEDEPEFFAEAKEKEDKSKTEDGKETPENEDDEFFDTLTAELKEKGIFQNVEIKEGEKITEEKFFELQDAEIEARVEETFEAFFEELDEDAKAFLKFKKNGGRTEDFFETFGTSFELEELDADNESHRNYVLQHYLSNVEKMDAEEVKDRIDWLKENGKDKTYAEKYFNKIKDTETKRKEQLVAAQEQAIKARDEAVKQFNQGLNETLTKVDKVGAFSFSKDDQKELGTYITKPSIKVGKNKYVPPFQAEIGKIFRAETEEDKQKLLLIAKLVKTNFDVADLVTETKTKVVKEAKSKLQQAKAGVKPSSSGNYSKKSLSDFFPDS